jgi:hypothetical protein
LIFRIILLIIAWILLGAHFLRDNNLIVAIVCLLVPLLLLVKKRWVLLLLQILTYVGVVIWLNTTYSIVQERISLGDPWIRVVVILGGVALFTTLAGLLLNSKVIKEKYLP